MHDLESFLLDIIGILEKGSQNRWMGAVLSKMLRGYKEQAGAAHERLTYVGSSRRAPGILLTPKTPSSKRWTGDRYDCDNI